MRNIVFVGSLLLLLFASPSEAQQSPQNCLSSAPFFGGNAADGNRCHSTVGGAAQAVADALVIGVPSFSNVVYQGIAFSTHSWHFDVLSDGVFFGVHVVQMYDPVGCPLGETLNTSTGVCEGPPMCDGTITGQAFLRPVFSGGSTGNICHESSQCVMTAQNVIGFSSSDLVEYIGTDQGCNSEPEVPIGPENSQDNCIAENGNTWCTDPNLADENCGYYNNDYVCLGAVPDGGCTFFGNGDMACSTTASSPPAPDNGTPGVTATPDGTINNNGSTTNIFNNTTVTGSAGGASGTQQGDGPSANEPQDIDFSEIIEQEPDFGIYDDAIVSQTNSTSGELDNVLSEIGDPNDFGVSTSLGTTINDAFQYSACTDIVLNAFGNNVTLSCAEVSQTRDVLGWIARVIFLLAIWNLVMRGPE